MRSIFSRRGRGAPLAGGVVVVLLVAAGCNLGAPPQLYTAPGADVAAGDLNGDGHVDLVSVGLPDMAVLLNDGHGGFTVHVLDDGDSSTFGTNVALADVDADGHLDIVTSHTVFTPDSTFGEVPAVQLGRGDGSFGPQMLLPDLPVTAIYDLQAGDLDGDGLADVVVTHGDAIVTYLSTGGGHFELAQRQVVRSVWDLALTDLDADGHLDLVGAGGEDLGSNNVAAWLAVLQGDGTGQLAAPVTYPTGDRVYSYTSGLAVDDVDGDGVLDVATAVVRQGGTDDGYELLVFPGTGGGALGGPQRSPATVGGIFAALAATDIDADGHADLVVANYQGDARVVYGDGSLTFPANHGLVTAVTPIQTVLTTDVNGDHRPDPVFGSQSCTAPSCDPSAISVMPNLDGRPSH
jgi:hypothetical protein